ncbi:methionyl-tRNA formyltransferase [Candidatus Saccharibacteria bacterium]|nr:methionyl-tRNA formyltransferase [Candidatus Saccharibacteria bacterium]
MKPKIIFFGNGPLANISKDILKQSCEIIAHIRTKTELETVKSLKESNPEAFGVLASFGVLIKPDILNSFEPEGILNIHPSLLPLYRGASPIESAILNGDSSFSVSVMKLVKAMDAGPIYYQTTLPDLPLEKSAIYTSLATSGASWIVKNLPAFLEFRKNPSSPASLFPNYHLQDNNLATFTNKLDKKISFLTPEKDSSKVTLRKIIAYQGFPKPKYKFFEQEVIILSAHIQKSCSNSDLAIKCADNNYVIVDRLQPPSRKPMDAKSFLNGLRK